MVTMMVKPVSHSNNMDENTEKKIQLMFDEQTKLFFKEINEVKATLAPIAEIYNKTQGFNSVMKFLFKNLIIPLSIIVGIIISVREINHK